MGDSRFITAIVPAFGSGTEPSILAQASANEWLRVDVSNVGPNLLFFAHDITPLNGADGPTGNIFRMATATSHVWILAPLQKLLAVGSGAGGLVSIATSVALPLGKE